MNLVESRGEVFFDSFLSIPVTPAPSTAESGLNSTIP
jgi:hypothetical protein